MLDVFRDPLSILVREADATAVAAPVAMVAPSFATKIDVPIWPSGLARLDDGILELTPGDGLRVATRDILDIALVPALGARLQLTLAYRDGFATVRRRYWVAVADHDHLQRLVTAVRAELRAHSAAA
jgi:hypothetical protein